MILPMKRRWLLWLCAAVFFSVVTVLWIIVIRSYQDYQNIPLHHLIGNRPSSLKSLKENGFPFSFLVIGDTRGSEISEALVEQALMKGDPSFIVMLGDIVRKPDIWRHRFFLKEMMEYVKLMGPVFLTPGNHDIHDIDEGSQIKIRERQVTPEVYDGLYGARNFNFIFNDCLFIICDIGKGKPGDLNYLRDTLSQNGKNRKHIFVFRHVPPSWLVFNNKSSPERDEFSSLLETYKVTTIFFGNYHGYVRVQRGGVNYVISGGGGSRLKKVHGGEFHHILRITVDADRIREDIISVPKHIELDVRLEETVFILLFPILQGGIWKFYAILVILLAGTGYSILSLLRTFWHNRAESKLLPEQK